MESSWEYFVENELERRSQQEWFLFYGCRNIRRCEVIYMQGECAEAYHPASPGEFASAYAPPKHPA
jgi:hypothetical protein